MSNIAINTKVLSGNLTGVQRYIYELLAKWTDRVDKVSPSLAISGMKGHAWEQAVLPARLKGRLLFSPSNTGPLMVERQVVTVHDVVPLDHPEWLNPRFASWYRFLLPKLVKRARLVVAISEFTKARLVDRTGISAEKVMVVPNGVDGRFRPEAAASVVDVAEQLQLPTRHYILSLGSLEPRKNLSNLIKGWAAAQVHLPDDIWLVIAGVKGKSLVFRDVNGLDRLPPRVFLAGHVPDDLLPSLYASAIAFAYLSVYEGFGLPPLEAMASGTPALTGNRTALLEVVGDAALTVNPYDVEAIADGLQRLVEDTTLRNALRMRGLERSQALTWDRTANDTWQVLQQALLAD